MAWSSGMWEVSVECPFYKWARTQQKTITCEGAAADSNVTLWFKKLNGMEQWAKRYCWKDYKHCPMYRAVLEKYTHKEGFLRR